MLYGGIVSEIFLSIQSNTYYQIYYNKNKKEQQPIISETSNNMRFIDIFLYKLLKNDAEIVILVYFQIKVRTIYR
mgnify:CR=1 FL=1